MLHLLLMAAATAAPAPSGQPYWGRLGESAATEVIGRWTSARPPAALELCIARAFARGVPTVLRDGGASTILFVYIEDQPRAAVAMKAGPKGTGVELRLRGPGWDKSLPDRIRACL
jgi:hypothetical protein